MLPFVATIQRKNGAFFKAPRNLLAMGSMPFTTRSSNLNTYLRPWNKRFAAYLTGMDVVQKGPTSGGGLRRAPFTLKAMAKCRANGDKITMVTAYDCQLARIAQDSGVDMILVGDSLGNVVLGHATTTPVTMEDMVIHTAGVRRGLVPGNTPFLVGDMPFASYLTEEDALRNGARLVKEGGADGVKLEGGARVASKVRALTETGIPVIGHIGLTPQTAVQQGGLGMQGKNAMAAKQVVDDAKALQEAGAIAIVLECVPSELASLITAELLVPTIGIGAGSGCSGQVLVMNDLCGFTNTDSQVDAKKRASPFFVREFAQAGRVIEAGLKGYVTAVREGAFPEPQHSVNMKPKDIEELRGLLGMSLAPEKACMKAPDTNAMEASTKLKQALVVGAGSMGCMLAAALDSAGIAVSIASSWHERREVLAGQRGVTLEAADKQSPRLLSGMDTYDPNVELPMQVRGRFDCVIVATKASGVAQVAAFAASAAAEDAIVVGVQNGMGSLHAFDGLLTSKQALHGAVTTVGAKLETTKRVTHTINASRAQASYFRLLGTSPKSQALCDALDQGFASLGGTSGAVAVETLTSSIAIKQATWEKLAVSAVLNPICALYGVPNGSLSERRFEHIRRSLAAEVDTVAAAHGVTIPGGAEAAALACAQSTAKNICSTLTHVRRGVETEVDFINGYVSREAERLGLQGSANKQIQAMVSALVQSPEASLETTPSVSPPVFDTVHDMRVFRRGLQGRVGFVPTMGGLHEGHLSLIQACRDNGCDHVVVSIFVNGSQFAAHEDFDKYPRDHSVDLMTLREKSEVDAVFAPLAREMYPRDPRGLNMRTRVEPVDIAGEAEALARPHFFGGVATVCASFFNIVQPDVVAFGQKDALQCAVIQNLVEDLHMPIEVVIVDTARTSCGLAMSTRNKYLTPSLHDAAQVVPNALHSGAKALQDGSSLEDVLSLTHQIFENEPLVKEVEYVTIADRRSGKQICNLQAQPLESEAVISCAIKMEHERTQVRLIDNICVQL